MGWKSLLLIVELELIKIVVILSNIVTVTQDATPIGWHRNVF